MIDGLKDSQEDRLNNSQEYRQIDNQTIVCDEVLEDTNRGPEEVRDSLPDHQPR